MTRGRLLLSFLLFIALCASLAYWALQLYDPPLRPVAPSAQQQAAPRMEAAAAVFGGQASSAPTASNFQLRGVIVSGTPRDSVAIIAVEGKPPQAFRANTEVVPGVKVHEVHARYVLLSQDGALKRVELPAAARDGQQGSGLALWPTVPATVAQPAPDSSPPIQPAPAARTTVVKQDEQDPPAEAASDTSAPSAETSESDDEIQEEADPAETQDPAEMQTNPPRRE